MLITVNNEYLVIDRRGRVILATEDPNVAELCEQRLAAEEHRQPQYSAAKRSSSDKNPTIK
jgi:hypothetical protein